MNKLIVFGFLSALLAVGGCASPASKGTVPAVSSQKRASFSPHAEGGFSQLNPHYKDRAGVFYDIRYVSPSAEALFKIADIRPDQMRKTMEILRSFVDEWLGFYVEGYGSISPEDVNMCVQTMDESFDALLDDLQRKQYRIWRDDTTGDHNKLRFLMSSPTASRNEFGGPQHIELSFDIKQACITAIGKMKLVRDETKSKQANNMADAQNLIFSNLPIANSHIQRACVEYDGWFLFSRLNSAGPDDGSFKTGIAVKKGTTEIYKWK